MILTKDFYYCNHCKKIIKKLDDLYFVEDGGQRGFCSEPCIENFFAPIMTFLEKTEEKFRRSLSLFEDELQKLLENPQIMERSLRIPDEIWHIENGLKEEIYALISHHHDEVHGRFHVMIVCMLFARKPSFILISSVTKDSKLLAKFQIGEQVKEVKTFLADPSDNNPLDLPPEVLNLLEHQKSLILATLLSIRTESDIPFEKFPNYDQCIEKTLSKPDEVYESEIDSSHQLHVFIRSFAEPKGAYYYIVIALNDKHSNNELSAIPLLSFPTKDANVYREFSKGRLLQGQIKS